MNPYPGLRPFRADESDLFFGRELALDAFATRVEISPVTVMVARSGVGKSSFLTCRLIPELSKACRVLYVNEWGGSAPDDLIDRKIPSLLEGGPCPEKPVLILDQFEDIFKVSYPREKLWDRLAEVLNGDDPPLHVLFSMREEWLGAWGETTDYLPRGFEAMVRLGSLTRKELIRAIERPAQVEGSVGINRGLASELLDDLKRPSLYGLGDEYVEPGLLQLVCRRLWNEAAARPDKLMSPGLYEALGRSGRIIREFVWTELGLAGSKGAALSASDRVFWVGLTRHFTIAPGVKSIVTPASVAKNLRVEDMGAAGRAVVAKDLNRACRKYLRTPPQRRAEPPARLTERIASALEGGFRIGFLKRYEKGSSARASSVYELAHDSLGEILGQFALEFDRWVRVRFRRFLQAGVLLVVAILAGMYLPFYVFYPSQVGRTFMVINIFIMILLYVPLFWAIVKGCMFLYHQVTFIAMRRLMKGRVPFRADQGTAQSSTPSSPGVA